MGNILSVHVHAANILTPREAYNTFEKAALYRYPTIQAGCADCGYRGPASPVCSSPTLLCKISLTGHRFDKQINPHFKKKV